LIFAGIVAGAVLGWAAQDPAPMAPPTGGARERAITKLQARAALVHPGSREAGRLAAELERIGSAYLSEGETGRASELLSDAYALDEENGLILAELTLCELRMGDFDAARFYLRLAEERVSRAPPEIYGALGDAYFDLHRLEDAVFAWEEFVRLGGSDPTALARLSRARDELALSRGQRSRAFEHFLVFADSGVGEDLVLRAGEDLEAFYAWQGALLGRSLRTQVAVLYSGRAYFSLVSAPEWSSGLFDGKIRVLVDPGATAPEALSGVLAHELAHALVRRAAGDRAPVWFHEGLAQWCEGRRIPVREVRSAVGAEPAGSVMVLDRRLATRLGRSSARSSYAQALSLVEFLVASRGTGAVACLLERLSGESAAFREALREETGLSEADVFAGWRAWAGI
jgi:tetratricopeptide (TPR) repeat protein